MGDSILIMEIPRNWKDQLRELKDTPSYKIELEDYSELTLEEFKAILPKEDKKCVLVGTMLEDYIEREHQRRLKMAIYKVTLYYSGKKTYEVEAKDEEYAVEKAEELLCDDVLSHDQVDDSEVELADCQYTDQQELSDRERDL